MKLGVPESLAGGLLSYDYYEGSLVTATTRGSVVSMVQSTLMGTLGLAANFFTARIKKAGYDISATVAVQAAELAAADLLDSNKPFNVSSDDDLIQHMNSTFQALAKKLVRNNKGRMLAQEAQLDISFDSMADDVRVLAKSAAQVNGVVAKQQDQLVQAVNSGQEVDPTRLAVLLADATKAAVTGANDVSRAAAQLGNQEIDAATFETQ